MLMLTVGVTTPAWAVAVPVADTVTWPVLTTVPLPLTAASARVPTVASETFTSTLAALTPPMAWVVSDSALAV